MAGIGFLTLQVALVFHGQFSAGNHFQWAPHTAQVRLELDVEVDGRRLNEDEARRRYRLIYYPWEAHSIHNVTQLIRQYERTYGAAEEARVTLRYSVNGREPRVWRWPER